MKPEILNKWIDALNSGKYKKCIGALKKKTNCGTQFCGLGVLCDIYSKEKGIPWDENDYDEIEIHGESGQLPFEVAEWAGIEETDPIICHDKDGEGIDFTTLNDRKRKSFKQLAELLVSAQAKKII